MKIRKISTNHCLFLFGENSPWLKVRQAEPYSNQKYRYILFSYPLLELPDLDQGRKSWLIEGNAYWTLLNIVYPQSCLPIIIFQKFDPKMLLTFWCNDLTCNEEKCTGKYKRHKEKIAVLIIVNLKYNRRFL